MGGGASRRVPACVTVLFTDLAEPPEAAAARGDPGPRDAHLRLDGIVRSAARRSDGREVGHRGAGLVATFRSPRKAIACARAIVEAGRASDLPARAGIHSQTVERAELDVAGSASEMAARIGGRAKPHEVLVSDTVRDLVADSGGLVFVPRGTQTMKGTPGRRRLFAVSDDAAALRPDAESRDAAPIRLIVADDHPLWRETLRGLLEHGGVAEVVAEAATGDEVVAMVASIDADVVVLDVDMPNTNGIDAVRAITDAKPGARVLMLSSSKERAEVLASVRGGASGYLLKTAGREDVLDAVRRVHHGEVVFPPEVSTMVLAELRTAAASGADRAVTGLGALTPREHDVLRLVASGASNHGVAKQLHLSAKTVEAHIAAIFAKLGLEASGDEHRRVQAAVRFLTESRALIEG